MFAICARYVWRSTDKGENWDSISVPGTHFGAIKVDPTNSQAVYISIDGIDIQSNDPLLSTDGGRTWTQVFNGRFYATAVIEFDPVEPGTVYLGVGPNRVYRSSDTGGHWETLSPVNGFLNTISIARTSNRVLYAGYVAGVSKSTDRGVTWLNLNLGIQPPDGIFVAVDPRDANVVYAGVWNNGAGPGGMYKTTDGGSVWGEINNGIRTEDRWIRTLVINPKNPDEVLIGLAESSRSILRTTDGGLKWSDFSSGMSVPSTIHAIAFDTLNNRIYAAASAGLYIHDDLTSAPSGGGPALRFDLLQNYPNPFNPSTTISFSIPQTSFVTVRVYDLLGRQVATLVGGEMKAGSHTVSFDGSDLSSGIYFYTLCSGSFAATKKLVLMK